MTRAAGPEVVVDARGEFCPIPVIRASDAVRSLAPGGTILLIADDPAIAFDLPAWARASGHRVEEVSREGREFRYRVHPDEGGTS